MSMYKKNKNQNRSPNLSEVLNKNDMAMASVNVFEMRWNYKKLFGLRSRSHSVKDVLWTFKLEIYLSYLFSGKVLRLHYI